MKILVFTFFLFFNLNVFGQGIEFISTTWQEALELAKKEEKLLFVDAFAEWCGPCKKMAKYEFVQEPVGDFYNTNFINLKLDMESQNGRTFDSQYPVSAYPTMFFINGEGEVIKKIRGAKKADDLIALGKQALKAYDTSGQYAEKYEAGDRSFATVYAYVQALNKVDKPSLKIANDYLDSNPDITDEQKLDFLNVAVTEADSRLFDMLMDRKDETIEKHGDVYWNTLIQNACNKTVDKAITFETTFLLDEAIEKAEKHMTEGQNVYKEQASMRYALAMNDANLYKESAENLAKIYKKESPEALKGILEQINNQFSKDEDMIELAVEIGKSYHKALKNDDSAIWYAKVLVLDNEYDDAEKVLKKQMDRNEKDQKSNRTLDTILKMLERKRS